MTTPRRRETEASVKRRTAAVLAAWREAGLPTAGVELAPDGTLRILASTPAPVQPASGRGNSCDGRWGGKAKGQR